MYYKDLSPYEYSGYIDDNHVNIGWLNEDPNLISKGKVNSFIINKILKMCEDVKNIKNQCRGFHLCPFCDKNDQNIFFGNGEVWFQGSNVVYIAPRLLGHYIKYHNYCPPQQFIDIFQKDGKCLEPKIIKEKQVITVNRLNPQESLTGIYKEAKIWLNGDKLYVETRWDHIEPYCVGKFVNNKIELEDKILFLRN